MLLFHSLIVLIALSISGTCPLVAAMFSRILSDSKRGCLKVFNSLSACIASILKPHALYRLVTFLMAGSTSLNWILI